jgi:hypothetical protein
LPAWTWPGSFLFKIHWPIAGFYVDYVEKFMISIKITFMELCLI